MADHLATLAAAAAKIDRSKQAEFTGTGLAIEDFSDVDSDEEAGPPPPTASGGVGAGAAAGAAGEGGAADGATAASSAAVGAGESSSLGGGSGGAVASSSASKADEHRQRIIGEILATERSYAADLGLLVGSLSSTVVFRARVACVL